jgi:hypothetical protein
MFELSQEAIELSKRLYGKVFKCIIPINSLSPRDFLTQGGHRSRIKLYDKMIKGQKVSSSLSLNYPESYLTKAELQRFVEVIIDNPSIEEVEIVSNDTFIVMCFPKELCRYLTPSGLVEIEEKILGINHYDFMSNLKLNHMSETFVRIMKDLIEEVEENIDPVVTEILNQNIDMIADGVISFKLKKMNTPNFHKNV